jgi:hypothetical protein
MSQLQTLWREFLESRALARDHSAHVDWFQRKRDEALSAEDYVFFSDECHKAIAEHSAAVARQNELHGLVVVAVESAKWAEPAIKDG